MSRDGAKPHRFLVGYDSPECEALCGVIAAEVAAGDETRIDEACSSCLRVTEIVCPYGEGEAKIDCQLWMECDCTHPDYDPQYEGQANFTYKFDTDKPVGDPDRYVRVWEEGSTAEGIALALAYELAMEDFDERHYAGSYEKVEPPQCWVATFCDDVDEALEECLGTLTPGWHEAYVDNGGDIEESYLVLYQPKEPNK